MFSLDTAEIHAQLDRILASDDFTASDRNRRFLAFILEEALAGRAHTIKAYTIATCVFGRGADFDPQIDSIVRIEAGRLRRCLERYYFTSGQGDAIIITIPKGKYVPEFSLNPNLPDRSQPTDTVSAAVPNGLGRSIIVEALEEEGDRTDYPNLARGFARRIVAGLSRFTDLTVFGADGGCWSAEHKMGERRADYILTGGTIVSSQMFCADLLLMDAESGQCIWGETFETRLTKDNFAAEVDDVARAVVRALAQPYGAIFVATSREIGSEGAEVMSSYASVVLYRRYARTFDLDLIESVRSSLEAAIVRDPEYADAFTCLSLVYTDVVRYGIKLDGRAGQDPRERMFALAHRAIDLAPNASHPHHALARAFWFTGDVEGSFEELEIARALNPYDTAVLADLGHQHTMMARWDIGIPLLVQAYAENPGLPSWYRVAFTVYHFVHGRFEAALAEARKVNANQIIYPHLLIAACAIRLGRRTEAASAIETALAIDPNFGNHAADDLAKRNVDPAIAEAVLEALADAGLPTRPRPAGTSHLRSVSG